MNTEFLVMAAPVLLAAGLIPVAIVILSFLVLDQRER